MVEYQTGPQMRRSIVAAFKARPAWTGLYDLYGAVRDRNVGPLHCIICFRAELKAMIDAREVLVSYDEKWGYKRYLWFGVQSTARAAVARAELEAIREGGTS